MPLSVRGRLLVGVATTLACAARASAQDGQTRRADPPSGDHGTWWIGPFAGAAWNSPARGFLGATGGRDHLFVGISASTSVLRLGPAQLSYEAQLLPLVRVTGEPKRDWSGVAPEVPAHVIEALQRQEQPAYAFGLVPFGVALELPVAGPVDVYGATAAGGLLFSRPFPAVNARRFNFTLEYGAGVRVRLASRRALAVGYRYHHMSNANTAAVNPGLDANVFYAGFQWSRRAAR